MGKRRFSGLPCICILLSFNAGARTGPAQAVADLPPRREQSSTWVSAGWPFFSPTAAASLRGTARLFETLLLAAIQVQRVSGRPRSSKLGLPREVQRACGKTLPSSPSRLTQRTHGPLFFSSFLHDKKNSPPDLSPLPLPPLVPLHLLRLHHARPQFPGHELGEHQQGRPGGAVCSARRDSVEGRGAAGPPG